MVNSSGSSNYSIFQSVTSPSPSSNYIGTAPLEVGMKFSSSVNGYISGLRYYKGVGAQGTHIGNLWNSNGTKLASATFTVETASGWQTVTFTTPVAITANTIYVVSYFSPHGDFVYTNNYFTTSMANGPLTALASTANQINGVYVNTTSSAFPTKSYLDRNYWADVIFSSSATSSSTYALVVKVQDNGTPLLSNQANITVNLNSAKSMSIISIPQDTISVGSSYSYNVSGLTGNETVMRFTANNLPGWLFFKDNGNGTGILEGIPTIEDIGSYEIILEGKDFMQSVQQTFSLKVKTVSEGNSLNQTFKRMHIYPNPVTNGILNVKLDEGVQEQFVLSILDMSGKLLQKNQYEQSNSLSLDLSTYPPGVYLIQLRSLNHYFSDKFIIR